jgi:hypothetical protein
MYPKVSFSDVPINRQESELAKKALAYRYLNFLR